MSIFEKYLLEEEEGALFATIKKVDCIKAKRDLNWIILMRETGIRLCVVAGPSPAKIHKHKLAVKWGLTIGDAKQSIDQGELVYRAETNKRNADTSIFLTVAAKKALSDLLEIHKKMTEISSSDWDIPLDEQPLILSRNNNWLSRRTFESRLKYWCDQANIPAASPHWLRHTWAKRYMDRATSPEALRRVQAVLGHQNINTTAIYTRPSKEDIAQAMRDASCSK